jgi:hypothetical protein
MITPLPKGAASIFSPVVVSGKLSCRRLHDLGNLLNVVGMRDQVYVVAGDVVTQQREPMFDHCLPQPLSVSVPVFGELEQEFPVMAAMSQMINISREDVTIGPWHDGNFIKSTGMFHQNL